MAKNILVNYDFNKNQILNTLVHILASAPGTPTEGQIYYNSTDETMYIRKNTAWLDLGQVGISDGDYGDITVGGTGTTMTIDAGAVTYAKIQNVVANNVFLGNNAGAGSIVDELTGTEATALLDDFTSALSGLAPGSGGGTTNFLRADGTWTTPGGGFASFDVGGDVAIDQTINSLDLLDIVGGTGIDTDVSKVATTVTLNIDLTDTAVLLGAYGSASQYVDITIDQQGRITSATEGNISILESQLSNLGTAITLNADIDVSGNGWVIDEDNMVSDLDTKVPTQQSVKAYIDNAVTAGVTHKGGYNAATNTPTLDTGSPVLEIGDMYTVTVAGTFFTEALEVGDVLLSDVDSSDAAALSDWTIVQTNIDQATESVPGFAALATSGEVTTGTNDTKIVTPLKLEGWNGGTNIITVGTIGTGTWEGTAINQTYLVGQSGTNTGDEVAASEGIAGIAELATQGETDTGTDDLRIVTPLKLATTLGITGTLNAAVRYTAQIGDTAATNIVVTHNIGRQFLTAQIFETSSPFAQVECDIEMDTVNATSFTFSVAPGTNEYTVVITG